MLVVLIWEQSFDLNYFLVIDLGTFFIAETFSCQLLAAYNMTKKIILFENMGHITLSLIFQ